MKRLALTGMAITVVVAAGVLPAAADDVPKRFRKGDSWCERHAQNTVDVDLAEQYGLVVGGGMYLDRPVTGAYGCYDVKAGNQRRGELVSTWVDWENGDGGVTCVKQSSPKSCKRTSVPLPFEATTPLGHPNEPWWVHILGVGFRYGYAGGVVGLGATGGACVPESGTCVGLGNQTAEVGPDIRYRARNYECAVTGGTCTRTDAEDGAAIGEGDAPLVDIGHATVDEPRLCVALDADPRC